MAAYLTSSIKEVIARLAMNTNGNIPSEYYDYFLEWIPQGMRMIGTKNPLHKKSETIDIVDHTGKLPCDLIYLTVVTDNQNRRIREGGEQRDYKTIELPVIQDFPTTFVSSGTSVTIDIDAEDASNVRVLTNTDLSGDTIKQAVEPGPDCFYKIQLGYIQTSFETGCVKVHYFAQPVDNEGYPLIPDNEWYKEALYYWLLSKMIAAGYEHKVFDYKDAWQQWLIHRKKAINSVSWPSIDTMERVRQNWTSLIPPTNLYDNFFINSEQIKPVS